MNITAFNSKIEHATRLLLVNTVSRWNDSVLLVEYPKSGGTWLGQLISSYLDIPFPRNRLPGLSRSLFHGHYRPNDTILRNRKIVFLVRDGRDVLVSLYHHQLIWNDKNKLNTKDVLYHRKQTGFEDFEDIGTNIGKFMDYTYNTKPNKLQHFTYMGNWFNFNKAWINAMNTSKYKEHIYLVHYEDLLNDTQGTMEKLLKDFMKLEVNVVKLASIVQRFSFESQSKRKKGEYDAKSFLRKGIIGDWKNYFGEEEKSRFKALNGDLLLELGYEESNTW